MSKKVYNELLVEFEFLIDLDMALFKLIKEKYNNKDLVKQDIISINDETEIIQLMLNRKHINVLDVLFNTDKDTNKLFLDFINNHKTELFKYAKAYDTFGLMVTFLKEASSVSITVLCRDELEADFIKKLNPKLETIIANSKELDISKYTVLYIKYYQNILLYNNIGGKHIYVPFAGFNMDETNPSVLSLEISKIIANSNIVHTIDLYTNIKYNYKGENNEQDIFKHSSS